MFKSFTVALYVFGFICGYASLSALFAANDAAAMEKLLANSDNLQCNDIEYGPWLPLRMQPTESPLTSQHSTYLSPSNAIIGQKMMGGFMMKQPMLLVRGKFGRIIIGKQDGLIQGMMPRILSGSFQGSYLREYSEGWNKNGNLKIVSQTPEKIVLEWTSDDSSRRISITDEGIIETSWKNGPKELSLFAGCHPYHYLATDTQSVVRFSQLLQMKRPLEGLSNFAMFGYRDASLEIKAQGIKSVSEEIWLDSGEMGWQFVQEYVRKNGVPTDRSYKLDTQFGIWMRQNAVLTYLGGGAIRKMAFVSTGKDYSLNYSVSCDGSGVLGGIQHKEFQPKKNEQPASGDVSATPKASKLNTVRIWPNDFNGWELRPLKLVQINPMPRFYEITLSNNTASAKTFEFDLKHADWIASADIESDPVDFTICQGGHYNSTVPEYVLQDFWKTSVGPKVNVLAKSSKTVLLKIQPVEESLGEYKFALEWKSDKSAGNVPLELKVIPSYMVTPTYYGGFKDQEDDRLFSYTAGSTYTPKPAFYSWITSPDVPSRAMQDKFLVLAGLQNMRKGEWVEDYSFLSMYIKARGAGQKFPNADNLMKPENFVKLSRDAMFMRKERFPQRFRMYMADEIFELIGGYKGRRFLPVPEVARISSELIKDCPTPCWFSFMQHGVDANYPMILPNDIPETFYYCGRDEVFRLYIQKLLNQRQTMVEKWKKDSEFAKRIGKGGVKSMCSFAISAQLHVIDYDSMRRQNWYAAFNGVNIMECFSLRSGFMYYANIIGCNAMLAGGNDEVIMTDRSLAWYDLREDMQWFGLVRMLKEKADPQTRAAVAELERKAFFASQRNEFDLARDLMSRAVKLMAPECANLPGTNFYSPVKNAEPLPDLFLNDKALFNSPEPKSAVVRKVTGGNRPAPTLDGLLDNSYLEEGMSFENFTLLNSHKTPEEGTTAYVAWDDKNLYVIFICNEADASKIVANSTLKRDEMVYTTDCVELLINRKNDGKGFMQFIVGAGGTIYDEKNGESSWNPKWQWITARNKGTWVAEMIIPMSVLGGAPKPGETWGINFARERVQKAEKSVWSPQREAISDPAQFGKVKFVK